MTVQVEVPINENQLDERTKRLLRRDALEAVVLRLFAERRISSAEAASDLGLTRIQFLELTEHRGIPAHDYASAELAADLADLNAVDRLLSRDLDSSR